MSATDNFAPAPATEAWIKLRPDLVRFLARRLGDFAQAEDLVQDLWVKLAQRPKGAIEPQNLRAFAFHAAAGLLANHKQKLAVRARLRTETLDVLWQVTDEETPEDHILGDQALVRMEAAINALPERTREILHWRRIEGQTQREISSRLGISQTAVEKHMRKAVAALALAAAMDDFPSPVRRLRFRRS